MLKKFIAFLYGVVSSALTAVIIIIPGFDFDLPLIIKLVAYINIMLSNLISVTVVFLLITAERGVLQYD